MEIIDQNWDFIGFVPKEEDILRLIELAGRTCYKSEDKITTGSAKKFVKAGLWAKMKLADKNEVKKVFPDKMETYDVDVLGKILEGIKATLQKVA